ncbi:MAG: hypothetical protein NTX03_04440, partial [Bacteroidetes bacterium]|nr:hypothetical protein [Bacteroidota bacterium]
MEDIIPNYRDTNNPKQATHGKVNYNELLSRISASAFSDDGKNKLLRETVAVVGAALKPDFCRLLTYVPLIDEFILSFSYEGTTQKVVLKNTSSGNDPLAEEVKISARQMQFVNLKDNPKYAAGNNKIASKGAWTIPGKKTLNGILLLDFIKERNLTEEESFFLQSV